MAIAGLNRGKEGASVTGDRMDVPGGPRSREGLGPGFLCLRSLCLRLGLCLLSGLDSGPGVIFTAVGQFLSGKVKLVPDGAPESEAPKPGKIGGSSKEPATCPGSELLAHVGFWTMHFH